ncbi:MAG: thiol-disulfide isomerase [Vicinamibacterales bacterium]
MTVGPSAALVVSISWLSFAGIATAQQAASPAPTFTKDVAPIFFAHCTTCHRPGEIAPMSLLTYKEARPWARSIAAQVRSGAMPPWHADPAIGHFANERRLTDVQKATVVRWVEAGAPEGNPEDLPPAPQYAEGWRIGQPDVVLEMQEDYPIPASGTIPYLYFEVPANFDEDRWIQAWEMRPGNPAVVHHVIVYVRPPQDAAPGAAATGRPTAGATATPRPRGVVTFAEGMDIPAGQTGGPPLPDGQRKPAFPNDRPRLRGTAGSIGGYVPGNSTRAFPAGTAMRLPKGSSLVFQMHYTTIGKPTADRTKMGLIFAKEPPQMPLTGTALVNGALHIPAGAANHRVDAEMTLNRDLQLFSMTPHTHVRGIRWYYEAIYPDGRREPILSVPNYDFEWQHEYQFARPLDLPAGTTIKASAWYDNSPANKANPDPTTDVWWGDQTWEEMMFTSFTWHVRAGGR